MRKILLLFFLINVYASYAQEDVIHLGYCNGEMAASSNIQLVGTGWVQSAIYLPASTIKTYAGNDIKSIRAGLVSRLNIDTLRVWIRTSLDGENIVQGTLTKNTTPSIARGWNEVLLDHPYSLTKETSGFYIGYSYRQRANVRAVSVVGNPVSNASYLKMGDGEWNDISGDGVLSIEAVVAGNNLPHYDLGLSDVRISPDPGTGENALKVVAVVHNYGIKVPDGFNITCQTPGINPMVTHINTAVAPSANSTVIFDIDPGVPTDNANLWTVNISSLDHNVDENESNNTFSAEYTFLRNVLVEEFTTENCVNCPRVASFFNDVMERNSDYKTRICPLCHHAGYYTDWLTQPCDNDYLWLYNEDGNYYAPSMMINRHPYFKGMFATNNMTATFLPESADELQTYLDSEMNGMANAVVGVQLDFNADSSQVTATVNCQRNANYQAKNPQLTICLVENNIEAKNQSGADGVYYQQHVLRAYNSTWGTPVVWNNKRFRSSCTFQIDNTWKKSDMYALAFIANYDSTNNNNCIVENSAVVPFNSDIITSVSLPRALGKDVKEVARYTADGRILQKPAPGLNLIKFSDGSVKKVFIK